MNQYAVLLVDDEEEVIKIIMKKLDWEGMGFRVAGYARNGVEALEMAEELQPDVVMTDIKMPYMDGLTLSRKLKESYRSIKVIIFSGFDEFEYAREAIKIEAEEYILKPVNSNELKEVFERIRRNLDEELDEKRNIDKLRAYYMESLPILQESFYTSLLDGRMQENQIEKYRTSYQIDLTGPYYVATMLHISTLELPGEEPAIDPFLLAVSVKKFAEEQLKEQWRSNVINYLGDLIIISQLSRPEELVSFTDGMDRICKMARRVCKAKVTAGVGYLCSEPGQLSVSYEGAKQAVSYRVLYGSMQAISISEMDPRENADAPWESSYIKKIIKQMKMEEEEPLQNAVYEFTEKLSESRISLQKYRMLILELIAEIVRFASNSRLNLDQILGESTDFYSQALQRESPEALGEWLYEKCRALQKAVLEERRDTTISFVTRAVEYITENYSNPNLSIETVCKHLSVSAAYFSTVFKKETGKTFIKYLTDYRMEQAVELLLVGNEKTYIIAKEVGYSDPNYFSYAFKKQFGMSPSKYKSAKTEKK